MNTKETIKQILLNIWTELDEYQQIYQNVLTAGKHLPEETKNFYEGKMAGMMIAKNEIDKVLQDLEKGAK